MSSAEPQQSSFTRRAPMKSEAEMKMEERAAAKKVHHFLISCTRVMYCRYCIHDWPTYGGKNILSDAGWLGARHQLHCPCSECSSRGRRTGQDDLELCHAEARRGAPGNHHSYTYIHTCNVIVSHLWKAGIYVIHTYTYIHTYIHAYIYIHTYIDIFVLMKRKYYITIHSIPELELFPLSNNISPYPRTTSMESSSLLT